MLAHPEKNTLEFLKAEVGQFSKKTSETVELKRASKACSSEQTTEH